ncbi:MAG TPA: hypothetical protein VK886_16705 [Vicinamibacterales bacterium]|nr:hypothetical protein [Vicinamibacterales bacterium]
MLLLPAVLLLVTLQAVPAPMTDIAERYVKLVLALGEHDRDYVDAYYGPPEWREQVKTRTPGLREIDEQAGALLQRLRANPPGSAADEPARLRHAYLVKQLESLRARVAMLGGRRFSFDEESRALYDAVAPTHPEEHFAELLRALDTRFPGDGPLIRRFEDWRRQFVIPPGKLDAVFTAAIAECRARTQRHIKLPPGESFKVEYVTGKSWSAYNWYQGKFRSLIQVNTDLPVYIDRAIDLACHEGYPGHHVYNALLEKALVTDRGWPEFSVYALFSPQSLIAEGTANFGIEVAFPGNERVEYERRVLFPLAGLDPATAAEYYEVYALVDRLAYAGNEAARRYLNGEIDANAAADWLERFALMPRPRAEQRVRFFDQYRSYVINYNLGKDLVRDYIEKRAAAAREADAHWREFERLLSSPRLPTGLR